LTEVFALPGGLVAADGHVHADAEVRALSGNDEQWLQSLPPNASVASVVSGLLARVVVRIGTLDAPGDVVRDLIVADREFALLQLRRITIGAGFATVLACPACADRMDVTFTADDIPVERRPLGVRTFERELRGRDGVPFRIVFHLPTGADQEAAAREGDVVAALVSACVEQVEGGAPVSRVLDTTALRDLDREIEALVPGVELAMDLTCPGCGHAFVAEFDLSQFLLEDLRVAGGGLTRDVHKLAFYYHWAAPQILGLPHDKRRQYLDLIANELTTVRA